MAHLATGESVITYGAVTDVGCVRSENQDACGKFPADAWDLNTGIGQLIIIADGMGGLDEGAFASKFAVDRISELLLDGNDFVSADDMRSAFTTANEAIFGMHADRNGHARMGTTCIALLLRGNDAIVGHVGDSRLYRLNAKGIVQLTRDHSNVAEMQRRGILTDDEAAAHPERSKLYRALGPAKELEVDIIDNLTLTPEEYFLLCTDGLHNKVDSEDMKQAMLNHTPEEACARLTALAKERGGEDNITVQVVHVKRRANFMERVFRRPLR